MPMQSREVCMSCNAELYNHTLLILRFFCIVLLMLSCVPNIRHLHR
jgi:hypothetical protein